jgi:V/A-type H+-transporting ATPase subunit I
VFDVVPWWILFAGIGVIALWNNYYLLIAGVAALILTQGRSAKSIPIKLVNGIGSIYNITGYFGDVLSYARLMALMLAGGAIAQAFNMIGAITGNIVTFLIIAAIGHAINLGLNLIGCYVHDLRLHCLEYLGKFYKDGGRAFDPLRINAKYVNIIK